MDNKYIGKSQYDLLVEKQSIEESLALVRERNEKDTVLYDSMKREDRIEAEEVLKHSLRISAEKIEQYTEELLLIDEALKAFE